MKCYNLDPIAIALWKRKEIQSHRCEIYITLSKALTSAIKVDDFCRKLQITKIDIRIDKNTKLPKMLKYDHLMMEVSQTLCLNGNSQSLIYFYHKQWKWGICQSSKEILHVHYVEIQSIITKVNVIGQNNQWELFIF